MAIWQVSGPESVQLQWATYALLDTAANFLAFLSVIALFAQVPPQRYDRNFCQQPGNYTFPLSRPFVFKMRQDSIVLSRTKSSLQFRSPYLA